MPNATALPVKLSEDAEEMLRADLATALGEDVPDVSKMKK